MKPEKPATKASVDTEFQRRLAGIVPQAGAYFLGAILVATGQISRSQLDAALLGQAKTGRRLGDELIDSGQASKGQIERGLFLQRKLLAGTLFVTTLLAPFTLTATSAHAGQTSSLPVSAVVIASAKIQTEHQLAQISISRLDVARGYVDMAAASRFLVFTNSRTGYTLEFHPVGTLFESVKIEGLPNPVVLGADGGSLVQRGATSRHTTHELSYRFMLRPDTRPGNYAWPLRVSVRAI